MQQVGDKFDKLGKHAPAGLKPATDALNGVSGAIGGLGGAIGAVKSGKDAFGKFSNGDIAGGVARVVDTVGGLAGSAGGGANLAGVFTNVSGAAAPGLGILSGGAQAISGGIRLASALSTKHAMGGRLEALGHAPDQDKAAGKDRNRSYDAGMTPEEKMICMGRDTSKINATEGGLDIASGSIKAAGSALNFAPVPGLGTAVSLVGTGIDAAKAIATDSMKRTSKKNTLEREIGLESQIQDVMQKEHVPESVAKHAVLKSMGMASGRRKEAKLNLTHHYATDLRKKMKSGSAADQDYAKDFMSDLGLHGGKRVGKDAIMEKLGETQDAELLKKKYKDYGQKRNWERL